MVTKFVKILLVRHHEDSHVIGIKRGSDGRLVASRPV
jgi:hypothetical protein